jgi:hypothetical protein
VSKEPFKLHRTWKTREVDCFGRPYTSTHVDYEASFWEGPDRAGDKGRYVRRRFTDSTTPNGWFLNTSRGVGFADHLQKAIGK